MIIGLIIASILLIFELDIPKPKAIEKVLAFINIKTVWGGFGIYHLVSDFNQKSLYYLESIYT